MVILIFLKSIKLQYCLFYALVFLAIEVCGIFVPQLDGIHTLCVRSLNHWTSREVPVIFNTTHKRSERQIWDKKCHKSEMHYGRLNRSSQNKKGPNLAGFPLPKIGQLAPKAINYFISLKLKYVKIHEFNTIVKTKQSQSLMLIGHQLTTLKTENIWKNQTFPPQNCISSNKIADKGNFFFREPELINGWNSKNFKYLICNP